MIATKLSATAKKKVIHLWFPNIFEFKGGIQIYLLDFLNALQGTSSRFELSVFDKLDRPGSQKGKLDTINFRFSGSVPKFLQTAYFASQLFLFAFLKKPDLLICGHVNFAPVAYWISRFRKVPYWILVYGVDAWDIQKTTQKKALRAADRIVSIGEFTRDRIIESQNIHMDKFSLLPVTFDSTRFKPSEKPEYLLDRYNLRAEQPVLLTVARLSKDDSYKGYDKIISALPIISKHIPDIHYLIVGKGDDRSRVEQLIKELNVEKYVTLAGFISDSELVDHYNLCDIFAMPSKGEGFGIVYLEALACGKPVIGGNQDGAIDALCHGDLGVLVNPDDVNSIADATIQILEKTYKHADLYSPDKLRAKAIDIFGFARFKETLLSLMESA